MKYGTMSYLSSDEGVLMIQKRERKDDPNSGYFTLPGGKLTELEKQVLEGRLWSAIRETMEETGLLLTDPILRGTILFDNNGREFDNWPNPEDFLVYIFTATTYTGSLIPFGEEGRALWVPESKLSELPSNPGDRKMYQWLRDGRNLIGVIKHNGKVLDEENTFVDFFL